MYIKVQLYMNFVEKAVGDGNLDKCGNISRGVSTGRTR